LKNGGTSLCRLSRLFFNSLLIKYREALLAFYDFPAEH
jgi:hypothetical protein